MRVALKLLHQIGFSFWLGEMLFFAFVFAPKVFTILPRPMAAELQANIFPGYFLVGMIASLVILLVRYVLLRGKDAPPAARRQNLNPYASKTKLSLGTKGTRIFYHPAFAYILILLAGSIFAFSYFYLTPAITSLQGIVLRKSLNPADPAIGEFNFLHHMSTSLNGVALFALLIYAHFGFKELD